MPGKWRVIHLTVASETFPTDMVLVSRIGVSSSPHSCIWVSPDSSPAPFRTNEPAIVRSKKMLLVGTMQVTPVRTGPLPDSSLPSPAMSVVCPTRTPGTSVIAFHCPGEYRPMLSPRSR